MVKKQIVCLANSRLKGGRCIAGKDTERRGWIRPVNGTRGAGLSLDECQYEGGNNPKVLDIIEVPLLVPYPHGCHHSENWLLAPKTRLTCKGKFDISDLANLTDDPEELWGGEGVYVQDRIEADKIGNYSCSLYFIRVQDMILKKEVTAGSKKQVRGVFTYHGANYNLSVTDPKIESVYTRKSNGEHPIGECYVTVSLAAEPWGGAYYKLIAAIITPERVGERTG